MRKCVCEVYQFIFFLWCIGNLIFSSIWKEKCSLYSLAAFHCECVCEREYASNALKLTSSRSFSFSLCCSFSVYRTLSLPHSIANSISVACFYFSCPVVLVLWCLLLFICRFLAKTTALWIFVARLLHLATFYRSLILRSGVIRCGSRSGVYFALLFAVPSFLHFVNHGSVCMRACVCGNVASMKLLRCINRLLHQNPVNSMQSENLSTYQVIYGFLK